MEKSGLTSLADVVSPCRRVVCCTGEEIAWVSVGEIFMYCLFIQQDNPASSNPKATQPFLAVYL